MKSVISKLVVCLVVAGASAALASSVTLDGTLSPGEWDNAPVRITDALESAVPANYDVRSIYFKGREAFDMAMTVTGAGPDMTAVSTGVPYLRTYFTLTSTDNISRRYGLAFNTENYPDGLMHLITLKTNNSWQDLGTVSYAVASALEVEVPWALFPAEMIAAGPVTMSNFTFIYNVTPGDANNDGRVNIQDLTILNNNYGQAAANGWRSGDFNGDGKVDIKDLTILNNHYGWNNGRISYDLFDGEMVLNDPIATHAPEPVTMLSVLAGVAGVGRYVMKRRKARQG